MTALILSPVSASTAVEVIEARLAQGLSERINAEIAAQILNSDPGQIMRIEISRVFLLDNQEHVASRSLFEQVTQKYVDAGWRRDAWNSDNARNSFVDLRRPPRMTDIFVSVQPVSVQESR